MKVIRAVILLPFMATVVIPGLILRASRPTEVVDSQPAWFKLASAVLGFLFVGLGFILMAKTIAQFASEGRGTLAPWDPPRKLVVSGVYRYVRNPMISGVISILLGESFIFRSQQIAVWFSLFTLVNLVYIPLLEEPGLERRFGEEYRVYKKHVPRWIPRRTPWVE